MKWKKHTKNEVKKIGKAFLSYNPKISDNIFDEFLEGIGQAKSRVGKDETALTVDGVWYILNGDFREDYDKCKTEDDCLKVYKKHKKKNRSDFSTD